MSSIPVIDDTTHGTVRWWVGQGPVNVDLYLGECSHLDQRIIAYGWDLKHYELVKCDYGCNSRAWSDERGRTTTTWMQPVR